MTMNNQGRPSAASAEAHPANCHHLRRSRPRSRREADLRTGPRGRRPASICRSGRLSDAAAGRTAAATAPIGLPGLREPEVVRHYVRLSRMNYAIDAGLYPLGSCTMKHNPRLNEKMARLPGFGDLHPLQPQRRVQGALDADRGADALADRPDRHAGRGDEPEGGRAWRILRPADHPRGARRARRNAPPRAGAGIGAWHQSGDRRALPASRSTKCRPRPTAMSMPTR